MSFGESKGKLYYVRLKTNCGVLYKIGFTKLESVEKRLGYRGSGDEQLIDKIFLFLELDDAYQVEQELHQLLDNKKSFGEYSAIDEFPLCRNGQSELYTEDVLKFDQDYTVEQRDNTTQIINNIRILAFGEEHKSGWVEIILMFPIMLISRIFDFIGKAERMERMEKMTIKREKRIEVLTSEIKQKLLEKTLTNAEFLEKALADADALSIECEKDLARTKATLEDKKNESHRKKLCIELEKFILEGIVRILDYSELEGCPTILDNIPYSTAFNYARKFDRVSLHQIEDGECNFDTQFREEEYVVKFVRSGLGTTIHIYTNERFNIDLQIERLQKMLEETLS